MCCSHLWSLIITTEGVWKTYIKMNQGLLDMSLVFHKPKSEKKIPHSCINGPRWTCMLHSHFTNALTFAYFFFPMNKFCGLSVNLRPVGQLVDSTPRYHQPSNSAVPNQNIHILLCFPPFSKLHKLANGKDVTCVRITEDICCCTQSHSFYKWPHFCRTQSTIKSDAAHYKK